MFARRRKPPAPEMKALAEPMPAAPPEPEAAPEPVPEPCANVISDDARINGSILAVRDLEIAGIVRGDIECHGRVEIREGGEVHGHVVARELVIAGLVEGDVDVAGRLGIASTGRLHGDASARTVAIDEGAEVTGSCSMGVRAAAGRSAEPEALFLRKIMDDDDDPVMIGRTAIGA